MGCVGEAAACCWAERADGGSGAGGWGLRGAAGRGWSGVGGAPVTDGGDADAGRYFRSGGFQAGYGTWWESPRCLA